MQKKIKVERDKDIFDGCYISTGSTLLDCAISGVYPNGGIGRGKITQVYGSFSTMKTILAKEVLGSTQRLGGTALFVDAEYTFDFDRAHLFGLDIGKWSEIETREQALEIEAKANNASKGSRAKRKESVKEILALDPKFSLLHTNTVENFFEEVLATICEADLPKPVCVVVDSMTALPSCTDMDTYIDDPSYKMARAKNMGLGFKKYLSEMNEKDITLFIIDQTRDKINAGHGKKHTTSGGNALGFYASTRLFLKHTGTISNDFDYEMGISVKADVEKNKIYAPHNKVPIKVLWDIGIDDITSNIEWLLEQTPILKSVKDKGKDDIELPKLVLKGSWYSWGDTKLGQGINSAIQYIEDNKLWKELEAEVKRVWDILHMMPTRTNRHSLED